MQRFSLLYCKHRVSKFLFFFLVINRDSSDKKAAICGLVWKPKGDADLAYTDNLGNIGLIDDFIPATLNKVNYFGFFVTNTITSKQRGI